MLKKIYTYLQKYKDDKIQLPKKSTLFQKSINVYNDTIYILITFLQKISYKPTKSEEPNIQFHEDCVYY